MKTTILHVEGMMCSHCEHRIISALTKHSSIKEVHANAEKNEVTCTYLEDQIQIKSIITIIEEQGYDVISNKRF